MPVTAASSKAELLRRIAQLEKANSSLHRNLSFHHHDARVLREDFADIVAALDAEIGYQAMGLRPGPKAKSRNLSIS
jgi:hypothetical protein